MEYVYAALLLHKLGKSVDEAGIKKIMQAAGADVDEAKIKVLLASLSGVDIAKELENASVMAVSSSAGAASAPAEEKKEEVKTEAAAEGLSALFG